MGFYLFIGFLINTYVIFLLYFYIIYLKALTFYSNKSFFE